MEGWDEPVKSMITFTTIITLKKSSGKAISDFFLNCTDKDYQSWWEGTHLAFHTIERHPNDLGNLVYFDEYIGSHRLKFIGEIKEIIPGRKLTWQMKKIVRLPGWLTLEFEETNDGVNISHILAVGFDGIGKLFDPLLKLYFSSQFEKEMENHAQTEFQKLAEILS
jgi:hypothetical protein